MPNQPLFTPYRMGDLDLPNRIVMAPLTRMRAHPSRTRLSFSKPSIRSSTNATTQQQNARRQK